MSTKFPGGEGEVPEPVPTPPGSGKDPKPAFPVGESTVPDPVAVPDTAATDKPDAADKWKDDAFEPKA